MGSLTLTRISSVGGNLSKKFLGYIMHINSKIDEGKQRVTYMTRSGGLSKEKKLLRNTRNRKVENHGRP